MKRVLSLMLAVVIAVTCLGFAPAVFADDMVEGTDGSAHVEGAGSITAQGDGIALLYGRGVVELEGNGILWIKDGAGDATIRVTGTGQKTEFPDGWIQYAGFRGTAYIKGSRIGVVVAGTNIDLSARGRGRCILWGHGSYNVNGNPGEWEAAGFGTRVKLAATDAS